VAGTYSVTHVRHSVIPFFAMLWDIDLIFGMWVYNDKLQIKFTFRSSPMIFGRVMTLGLWNLAKYLVVTALFHYDWRYWIDFWQSYDPWTLKFGQIFSCHRFISLWLEILNWFLVWECIIISYRSNWNSFRLNDFWPTYSCWALKFGQIFSCHHFISLWYEILTWFLVWECIIISYRSTLKFIPVEWFLANLQPLGFEIWPNI
jgi:hypothetical protein